MIAGSAPASVPSVAYPGAGRSWPDWLPVRSLCPSWASCVASVDLHGSRCRGPDFGDVTPFSEIWLELEKVPLPRQRSQIMGRGPLGGSCRAVSVRDLVQKIGQGSGGAAGMVAGHIMPPALVVASAPHLARCGLRADVCPDRSPVGLSALRGRLCARPGARRSMGGHSSGWIGAALSPSPVGSLRGLVDLHGPPLSWAGSGNVPEKASRRRGFSL